MNELARRADVAPTTVSNHFKTQESLIAAVVERISADSRVPDSTIFVGTRSLTDRLGILTRSMFEFFDRTMHWFDLLGAESTELVDRIIQQIRDLSPFGSRFTSYTRKHLLATRTTCWQRPRPDYFTQRHSVR